MNIQSNQPIPGLRAARIVLGICLLAALLGAGLSMYQVWQSRSFIEVEGTIESNEYDRARDKLGESHRDRERRRKTVYFTVNYRYTVSGREYQSNRIQAGTFGFISAANKRDFETRFPVGARVPVYVDPEQPERAVLVRGWSHITTMMTVLSGFFAMLVLFVNALSKGAQVSRR